jgi:hypothetical protein
MKKDKDDGIKRETIGCEIEFMEPMLGTVPKNADIYAEYIATKKPEGDYDDELESVPDMEHLEKKGWTGFHEDGQGLFIYDYMVKGQIKAAIDVLQASGTIKRIGAYKKWIDTLIFVFPRKLHFGLVKPDGFLERPIRVMTAQGPRVSVMRSDKIEIGRRLQFEMVILKNEKISPETVRQALAFGQFVGLGQWRGSGAYGRFKVVSFEQAK